MDRAQSTEYVGPSHALPGAGVVHEPVLGHEEVLVIERLVLRAPDRQALPHKFRVAMGHLSWVARHLSSRMLAHSVHCVTYF
jgi:hypothetical protein